MPKIPGGYYIKARKIQESQIQKKPPHVREIWDWLLMNANHSTVKYNGFEVKRGQLFRTYKEIRDGLSWFVGYRKMMYSENQTKKAMKTLRECLMIDSAKALGGVLITIINYDTYQNPKNYERTNDSTNERTNAEPMRNQGGTDNNKNVKNKKNETISICPDHYSKELKEKLNDFISNRKAIKSPMTENAIKLLISKIEKLSSGNQDLAISMIDEAIINNWKSIYEPKTNKPKQQSDWRTAL